MDINYTLLADGPTDVALIPILDWLLKNNGNMSKITGKWADDRRYPLANQDTLADRIITTISLYPCNLLFIHRDAERGPRYRDVEGSYNHRCQEIAAAIANATRRIQIVQNVCVVPIRMTEVWLLFNESAIRKAAGNPNGTMDLLLPSLNSLETLPRPKDVLQSLLKEASGLRGRRLADFPLSECVRRIPEHISDFSPLRTLSAFRHLEEDIRRVAVQMQ